MKKIIGLIAFLIVLSANFSQATNLHLLNKTGDKVYYEYLYFPFWKPLGNERVKEGWLDDNEGKVFYSYRFSALRLREKRFFTKSESSISSIQGDMRILQLCRSGECEGTMLGSLNATLWHGKQLNGEQSIVHSRLAFPIVLVITLDPSFPNKGSKKYIITEISSSYAGRVDFFNRIKALPTPGGVSLVE